MLGVYELGTGSEIISFKIPVACFCCLEVICRLVGGQCMFLVTYVGDVIKVAGWDSPA